jgi:hypothetical protein
MVLENVIELVSSGPPAIIMTPVIATNEAASDPQGMPPLSPLSMKSSMFHTTSDFNEPKSSTRKSVDLKKFPGVLISPLGKNRDGEDIMKVVLMHARQKTWNHSFAHGKFIKWTKEMFHSIFNDVGSLNSYQKPAYSTFKNAIAAGKKVLQEISMHTDLDENAGGEGENFPTHLRTIITLWNQLKNEAKDTKYHNLMQPQRNRFVGNSATGGVTGTVGIYTNAITRRASTSTEKRVHSHGIALRDQNVPDVHSFSSSGDSGSSNPAKKQKKAKSSTRREGGNIKANKNTALATSMENNHNTEKEMELIHKERESNYKKRKREMKFDRKLKIDERKLDLAEKKLEMKRQEFILQSLKDDCATEANYLRECDQDSPLYKIYTKAVKDAYADLKAYRTKCIESSKF